ncbi:phytanoyl-CoA dioxygenase family protein [Cordyceps javanica]|uniref:Phytanoyl-CoA dioxygenase family protein n=1 Tax=Cordyceps javanica TaxID=43265 RepID=A0A545VPE7_9HYPO|nr:phytanoyl-CoA dioxygenase family protein [Cordyceps javanica]TQW03620.1 phytanoyl-CoA dioxygenase family protein [Cordyceps javanica]
MSSASKREEAMKKVGPLIERTLEHGYVIIPDAFSASEIREAKEELRRLAREPGPGPASAGGRNAFEGYQTRRVYALLNKSRVFDKFPLHPDVLALNDYFLDDGFLVTAFHSIDIQPREEAQALHHDDAYIKIPRPHPPYGTAVMVALDDYTATNGSTVVIPGSHAWDGSRAPSRAEAVPVVMPAGSLVYFLGTLWHGGGANRSERGRRALTVQYCMSWMRQLENQQLAVDWERLGAIPPRLVEMMGYKVGSPFLGYCDGRSPRARVAQVLERWEGKGRSKM